MRRLDVIWHYHATTRTYTDATQLLGNGSAPAAILPNDSLYVAHNDWLSGLVLWVTPSGLPQTIIPETWDGGSESWQPLPVQERVDQLPIGHQVVPTGFDYTSDGMVIWNVSPYLWTEKVAVPGFPEVAQPPRGFSGFWVRLRNVGTATLTLARVLPQLYNTYATYQDVASFMGIRQMNEESNPSATYVRAQIRSAEDWLDDHTRRSWRPRLQLNERRRLNIYGTTVKYAPIWFICRGVLWNWGTTVAIIEGRSQDFFVSQDGNMFYFNAYGLGTLPIFGKWSLAGARQPESLEYDYVYGADFDTDPRSHIVRDIVIRRAAADVIEQADWSGALIGSSEISKPDKVRSYLERSQEDADRLQRIVMA